MGRRNGKLVDIGRHPRGKASKSSDTELHRVHAEFHRVDCYWRIAPESHICAKAYKYSVASFNADCSSAATSIGVRLDTAQ